MPAEVVISGITAKEIHDKYPALGGYEIICHLIREGTLVPFKLLETVGNGKYRAAPLNYEKYGISRRPVLGAPIGDQRFDAWDESYYEDCFIYDTDEIVFEMEAFENILALYPDILDFDGVLFSIDPDSGEVVHNKEGASPTPTYSDEKSSSDFTHIFRENRALREDLKAARRRTAFLECKIENLKQGVGPHAKTQAARMKQAEITSTTWIKRIKIAVELSAALVNRWAERRGDESWAKDGFTNNELQEMADKLGGLTQRGLSGFKKGFRTAFPEVLIKTTSGARRS